MEKRNKQEKESTVDEQEQISVTLEEDVGSDERCEAEETIKLRLSKTQILDDSLDKQMELLWVKLVYPTTYRLS